MAKKYRRPKNYKLVNVKTVSGGSSGDQTLIGKIDKIDAQGVPAGFLNNVVLSVMVNEAEQDVAAITCYLTTDNVWNENFIITARTTQGGPGGTVNLTAKRSITTNADTDTQKYGSGGPIYVWVEIGDYVGAEEFRYVAETWGRWIEFTEE